jgi:CHAT domain-containing protein
MVFADPVFEADDPRILTAAQTTPTTPRASGGSRPPELTRALRDVGTSGISRLLAARREARGITGLVPRADVALDFDASRANATLDLRDYRIVHFATHGFADGQHPELSGIVLSLFDRRGRPQDGFLRLRDIYNLDLPADLVVLSACSTGLGKSIAGEGMIGLVRGFMYAGSRRVLATLWKVDDEATSELMIRFYRQMFENGLSASAALRAAQLELRGMPRWHLPIYWAAFVLEGDWTEQPQPVAAPD